MFIVNSLKILVPTCHFPNAFLSNRGTGLLIKIRNESFKSNENIHKKEGGSYYVVSANKASSVTMQSPGNESQRKHTAILRISNRQSIQRLI